MRLSSRIYDMPYSGTRKLTPYINKAKDNGKKIIALYIGQPDIETPKGFFQAVKSFDSDVLAYGENNGNPELKKAMSNYYKEKGIDFSPDEIFVTVAGSEALLFSLMSTCDYGDNIIVFEPFYTDYNVMTKELNLEIKAITTHAEDGYRIPDADTISSVIDGRTKAILVNNPNNPTGVVYTPEEMKTIIDVALKHDLFIIADEVYREFVYDGLTFHSFAHFPEASDCVIIVDSVSKRYSACGARIGNIASKNEDFLKNITKLCQARICPPTLDQIGAIELYKTPSSLLNDINKEYQRRRDIAFDCISKIQGVVCKKPEGAFYLSAKLPVDSAEKFLIWMLEEFDDNGEVVMLSPIEGFYATQGLGTQEVRIAYVVKEEVLKRGMEILQKALLNYPGRIL